MGVEFHAAQGDKSQYVCAECGEPVLVIVGVASGTKIYKPCGHTEAAMLANIDAVVFGEGGAR